MKLAERVHLTTREIEHYIEIYKKKQKPADKEEFAQIHKILQDCKCLNKEELQDVAEWNIKKSFARALKLLGSVSARYALVIGAAFFSRRNTLGESNL